MHLPRRSFLVRTLCCALLPFAAFAADQRKKLVMLIAENEYETARTLPVFAEKHLAKNYRVVAVTGSTATGHNNSLDPIGEVADADIVLVSVRRRTPPQAQLDAIRRVIDAGKPVVGIRTASHAFALSRNQKLEEGKAVWPEFDHEVLGGNYGNHHGKSEPIKITVASDRAAKHPILRGVTMPFTSTMTLYRNTPLQQGAVPLLTGSIPGQPAEPIAWTFMRKNGGRTFYTSLGGPSDFDNPSFVRLLVNGIDWAATGR